MAAVVRRIALVVPLLLFLLVAAIGVLRGRPGEWHKQCEQFWQDQKWQEIQSLAANLQRLGEADPEVLFLSVLVSEQQKDPGAIRLFGEPLLRSSALNLRWEMRIASMWVPKSLVENIALYRTRAALGILISITVLSALAFLKRPRLIVVPSVLACIGTALILL